jgi:hypothetical protein
MLDRMIIDQNAMNGFFPKMDINKGCNYLLQLDGCIFTLKFLSLTSRIYGMRPRLKGGPIY